MVLFEDPKLFGRPTLLDTDASIVAQEVDDAELLSSCLSDLSDPIILRAVTKEATDGGCRAPIRLEFSWPYGYVKLVHHIRKQLEPSSSSYLAADTSGAGRLLTLVVELPEARDGEDKYCTGWIRSVEEPLEIPIAGLEGVTKSAPQSPELTNDDLIDLKSAPQSPEPTNDDLDCNMNESQQKLCDGLNVDEPAQPGQPTEPSIRDLKPFFSKEEAETLDAKEKCISLDQDDGSKKSMGWKNIARFFIAPDSKPELELQDLATRGHGSVQVDFRQVGFEHRKAFLVNVGLGASVANGVCLSNAVNHVLDALLTDSDDETTECYYVASSKLRRCIEPLLTRLGKQTGALVRLCETTMLPFSPSNELLPSESIVQVLGQKESVIDAVERMVDLCETDFKNSATWKSLHESENSSFSTESKEAAGQNNGWTSPEFGRTSWQDGKPTARHERHWPRQEQASPFVPNHGFRNMHDSGLSSQSQKCHKLDVIVFVPVALNQFLNRPLFCVEFSKHIGCHVMMTLPRGMNYGKFTGVTLMGKPRQVREAVCGLFLMIATEGQMHIASLSLCVQFNHKDLVPQDVYECEGVANRSGCIQFSDPTSDFVCFTGGLPNILAAMSYVISF